MIIRVAVNAIYLLYRWRRAWPLRESLFPSLWREAHYKGLDESFSARGRILIGRLFGIQ